MAENNVTKIMSVPCLVIDVFKELQESLAKLYADGVLIEKPHDTLSISDEWFEDVAVYRWRVEEVINSSPNNIILPSNRRLVFSCDEDRRLNISLLGFYDEFEKTILGSSLVVKLNAITDGIARKLLREEMGRRMRLATENQVAAGMLPSVATMKQYHPGYSQETALAVLSALPEAYDKYEKEGGRWGATIISKSAGLNPTTTGRYLKAFRAAGITEWLTIPMPNTNGKTDT